MGWLGSWGFKRGIPIKALALPVLEQYVLLVTCFTDGQLAASIGTILTDSLITRLGSPSYQNI